MSGSGLFFEVHFSPSPEEKKPVEEIIERTQIEIREEIPKGIIAF